MARLGLTKVINENTAAAKQEAAKLAADDNVLSTETRLEHTFRRGRTNKHLLIEPRYITTITYKDGSVEERIAYGAAYPELDVHNAMNVLRDFNDNINKEGIKYDLKDDITKNFSVGSFSSDVTSKKAERVNDTYERVRKTTDNFKVDRLFKRFTDIPAYLYSNGRDLDYGARRELFDELELVTTLLNKELTGSSANRIAAAILQTLDEPLDSKNIFNVRSTMQRFGEDLVSRFKAVKRDLNKYLNDPTFVKESELEKRKRSTIKAYKEAREKRNESLAKEDELNTYIDTLQQANEVAAAKGLTNEIAKNDARIASAEIKIELLQKSRPSEERLAFLQRAATHAQQKYDEQYLADRALSNETADLNNLQAAYDKAKIDIEDLQSNRNKISRIKEQLSTLLGSDLESMSDDDFKKFMLTMRNEDSNALFDLMTDAVNDTDPTLSYEITQALSKVLRGDKTALADWSNVLSKISKAPIAEKFNDFIQKNGYNDLDTRVSDIDREIERLQAQQEQNRSRYNIKRKEFYDNIDNMQERKDANRQYIKNAHNHMDEAIKGLREIAPYMAKYTREHLPVDIQEQLADIPYREGPPVPFNPATMTDYVNEYTKYKAQLDAFEGNRNNVNMNNYERYLQSQDYEDYAYNVDLLNDLFAKYSGADTPFDSRLLGPDTFVDKLKKDAITDIHKQRAARNAKPLIEALLTGDASLLTEHGITTSKRDVLMDSKAKQAFDKFKTDFRDYINDQREVLGLDGDEKDLAKTQIEKRDKLNSLEDMLNNIDTFDSLQRFAKRLNKEIPSRELGNTLTKLSKAISANPKGTQVTKFGKVYNPNLDIHNMLNQDDSIVLLRELAEMKGIPYKQLRSELEQRALDKVGKAARENKIKQAGTLFAKGQSEQLQNTAKDLAVADYSRLLMKYAPNAAKEEDDDITIDQLDSIVYDYVNSKDTAYSKEEQEQVNQLPAELRNEFISNMKAAEAADTTNNIVREYENANGAYTLKQILFDYIDDDKNRAVPNKLNDKGVNYAAEARSFERAKAQAMVDLAKEEYDALTKNNDKPRLIEAPPIRKLIDTYDLTWQDFIDYFNKPQYTSDVGTFDADKKLSKADKRDRNKKITALREFNGNLSKDDAKDILARTTSLQQAKDFVEGLDSAAIKSKLAELKELDTEPMELTDVYNLLDSLDDVDSRGFINLLYAKARAAGLLDKSKDSDSDNMSIGQQLRSKDPSRTDVVQAKDLDIVGLEESRRLNQNLPHDIKYKDTTKAKAEIESEVVPEEPKQLTILEQINNATSLDDFTKMNIAEFSDEELMAFMKKRAELKAKIEEDENKTKTTKTAAYKEEMDDGDEAVQYNKKYGIEQVEDNIEQVEDSLEQVEDSLEQVEDTVKTAPAKTQQVVNNAQQTVNKTQQAVNKTQQAVDKKQRLANNFKGSNIATTPSVANITKSLQNAVAQQTQDYDEPDFFDDDVTDGYDTLSDTTGNIANTLINNDLGRTTDEDIPEK